MSYINQLTATQQTKQQAMSFMSPFIIGLNTTEFVQVLNVISFSADRMTVLKGIKDTLLNAWDENKVFIATTCWSMSSDQQEAYAILRDVASRYRLVWASAWRVSCVLSCALCCVRAPWVVADETACLEWWW